jgi:hypothetical protein
MDKQQAEPMKAASVKERGLMNGPLAWRGADMRTHDEWIVRLSSRELEELDGALENVREMDIAVVGRDDFALPTLGPKLQRMQREILYGRGFAVLRGLDVAALGLDQAARLYWGIGTWFGEAISQNPNGHLLGHVTNIGASVDNPNQRGYQSADALPFHTDVAADIVGLFCIRPALSGGASSIVSAVTLHNEMLQQAPAALERLFESWYWDRRGEVPAGYDAWYQLPVFCQHAEQLLVAFVRRFIVSAERHDDVPALSDEQRGALDLLQELSVDPNLNLAMDFRQGDIQLINNYAILHSRAGYVDHDEPAERRHLLRLWLAAENGWALPDSFYARYPGRTAAGRPAGIRTADTQLQASLDPRAA